MFIAFSFLFFSLPLFAVAKDIELIEQEPEIEMSDVGYLERHQSHPNVVHFSQFFRNRVVNVIQAESYFIKRVIRRTPQGITLQYAGTKAINGIEVFLNQQTAATYFLGLTGKYRLLRKTPAEWLAHTHH